MFAVARLLLDLLLFELNLENCLLKMRLYFMVYVCEYSAKLK